MTESMLRLEEGEVGEGDRKLNREIITTIQGIRSRIDQLGTEPALDLEDLGGDYAAKARQIIEEISSQKEALRQQSTYDSHWQDKMNDINFDIGELNRTNPGNMSLFAAEGKVGEEGVLKLLKDGRNLISIASKADELHLLLNVVYLLKSFIRDQKATKGDLSGRMHDLEDFINYYKFILDAVKSSTNNDLSSLLERVLQEYTSIHQGLLADS